MPDTETGNRGRNRQKIPRIGPKEAARVFAQCENLLDSSTVLLVENLRQAGFTRFLAPLHEDFLKLAVQPDSWGERTRARLIAELFAGLKGIPAEDARVEEIVQFSNVVVPCFLLELGRRRQHIEIEFPANPCDSGARFATSRRAVLSGPFRQQRAANPASRRGRRGTGRPLLFRRPAKPGTY